MTPEEKGYSLRANRLRKRTENSSNVRRPLLPTDTNIVNNSSENNSVSNVIQSPTKLTYHQLKERGFTGTRYDAELVQNLGHYEENPIVPIVQSPELKLLNQPLLRNSLEAGATSAASSILPDFGVKQPPFPKGIRVHQRSLRCTPDRIRKRCQLGRAPSDSRYGPPFYPKLCSHGTESHLALNFPTKCKFYTKYFLLRQSQGCKWSQNFPKNL